MADQILPAKGPNRRPDETPTRKAHRENERFRDLIDLIICRDLVADFAEVREAWAEPYAALAEEMGFPVADVDDAAAQMRESIDRIDSA